ncbi:MAG: hypothetical protein ACE5FG_13530 [Myxococcota bacterium]
MAPGRAALIAVFLLSSATSAKGADCAGATLRSFKLTTQTVTIRATITAPGLTHAALLQGGGSLGLSIVAPDTPSAPRYDVTIPVDEFVSTGSASRFRGSSELPGRVLLRRWRAQADTILLVAKLPTLGWVPPQDPFLRIELTAPGFCARSCVSRCFARNQKILCTRSRLYSPPPEAGFGRFTRRPPSSTSPLCGLAIRTDGERCDFLIDESCLLPYPSSFFLRPDPTTPTGLRVDYGPNALPVNRLGIPVKPDDWNTLDGFSPGPMILALLPDTGVPVDLAASGVAFHTDFSRSLAPDHPTVLMNAQTGERVLHFAELDANTDDVTRRALILRPGRRLEDGTRYVVAIRDLVDENGQALAPRLAFRALRDGLKPKEIAAACGGLCADAIDARRTGFEEIFGILEANGVARSDLLLAWDFTTASTQALTGWMVSIRDQAFALGTPSFSVTSVDDGGGSGFDAFIWARIEGTFQAPLFMTADAPASRLNLLNGVPSQNGFASVPFVVDVPRSAVPTPGCTGACSVQPGRPTLWGHGLLGNRFQLDTLSELAAIYDFVIGAVDMQGMSSSDVAPSVLPLTQDLSVFHRIPERLHQGFLNHLLLGRLMVDPVNGFNSHPAFRFGSPAAGVIDTTEVYYSGGSQGGIFGLAILSIAEDFRRGFLAVPGANYSTLLRRSIDFNPFLALLRGSYPDPLDETLILALIQQLWDRAEPQGYLSHLRSGDLSDPPHPHEVLIHMATHDSQVPNLGTEIMLRSLGIPQLRPVHRSFVDIPELDAPVSGSAFVEIDPRLALSRCHTPGPLSDDRGAFCTTDGDCPGPGDPASRTVCASGIPPLTNQPPAFGNGAHGSTGTPSAGQQIDAFLRPDGVVLQFCEGVCDPE